MSTSDPSPVTTLRQLLVGNRITHMLYVAAELGLADLLADGPRTSDELSHRTHTHADALKRVLRARVHLGVFTEREDGRSCPQRLGRCACVYDLGQLPPGRRAALTAGYA